MHIHVPFNLIKVHGYFLINKYQVVFLGYPQTGWTITTASYCTSTLVEHSVNDPPSIYLLRALCPLSLHNQSSQFGDRKGKINSNKIILLSCYEWTRCLGEISLLPFWRSLDRHEALWAFMWEVCCDYRTYIVTLERQIRKESTKFSWRKLPLRTNS